MLRESTATLVSRIDESYALRSGPNFADLQRGGERNPRALNFSMERIMRKVAFLVLFCLTTPVHAGITFITSNSPQPDEENILLNSGDTGSTIVGNTNGSGVPVNFTSVADVLSAPSNGQARIEASGGLLHDVTVTVTGYNFQDFIG